MATASTDAVINRVGLHIALCRLLAPISEIDQPSNHVRKHRTAAIKDQALTNFVV
jgi:hypothetical protein